MKKRFWIPFLFLILMISLTACGTKSAQDEISEALSLDVSSGSEVSHYDTHSGNGDGVSCIALHFPDAAVLAKIQNQADWKALPPDETVQTLIYGTETETSKQGPYLTDEEGKPLVPEIQNGYYWLKDRQTEKDEETDILYRNSFNLDFGLYDADTNTLYFCQLDT